MTFFYDLNKKLDSIREKPETTHKQLNERDEGKPGKNFAKIARDAGERYGSKAAGERVAGAVRNKLRAQGKLEEGDMDESAFQAAIGKKKYGEQGMKALQKAGRDHASDATMNKIRNKYDKYDEGIEDRLKDLDPKNPVNIPAYQRKAGEQGRQAAPIKFADKIASAKKEVDEMLGDVAAEAIKGALSPKQKKIDMNKNGKLDANDFAMLRAGKNKSKEMDEGWDDMLKDVERRRSAMKAGEKTQGHKGEIEKTATGIRHTRRYDPKTGETDAGDDSSASGEKRGRGRPKGSKASIGAKINTGKSKLMTKESDQQELDEAIAKLEAAGYTVEKAPPGARAERMVKHIKKSLSQDGKLSDKDKAIAYATTWKAHNAGKVEEKRGDQPVAEIAPVIGAIAGRALAGAAGAGSTGRALGGLAGKAVADAMTDDSVEEAGYSAKAEKAGKKVTKDIEYDEKVKDKIHGKKRGSEDDKAERAGKKVTKDIEYDDKKKKVKEQGGAETPTASSGFSFGKGIYDSMNRDLESMIAESMNISMNMNTDAMGGPSRSLTVTATDDDALKLGALLKNAGLGDGGEPSSADSIADEIRNAIGDHDDTCPTCGSSDCGCDTKAVDEAYGDDVVSDNQPDWPSNAETSDDALQYSGGLNKPKSTGQTTIPVIASQDSRQKGYGDGFDEVYEELARIREIAGIREAAKPDFLDVDKDGNKKESFKKAVADKKEKKVDEGILAATADLWKEYKGQYGV
jgi:hypothetical protein